MNRSVLCLVSSPLSRAFVVFLRMVRTECRIARQVCQQPWYDSASISNRHLRQTPGSLTCMLVSFFLPLYFSSLSSAQVSALRQASTTSGLSLLHQCALHSLFWSSFFFPPFFSPSLTSSADHIPFVQGPDDLENAGPPDFAEKWMEHGDFYSPVHQVTQCSIS